MRPFLSAEALGHIKFQSLCRPVDVRLKLLKAYQAMNALIQTDILEKNLGVLLGPWWIRYVAR
jgi:hypothetical protein